MGGEEIVRGETHGSSSSSSGGGNIEKILVSIRVRPLNEKETSRNDVSDWECINNSTIICKNNLPERSLFPSAYTFDRVFGFDSQTKQVYEEGAREVVLCVLSGINSSIFAYGQTSSGKTYTMSGITEFAMDDIFDYIEKHKEREFSLKFSAMEIYNEAVRDLLGIDIAPLRLLDDPERGTVVEKLIEQTLRDRNHLEELLSVCETQRKIGETSLNETSSRSHQILRLTIESSARDYSGERSSALAASVSFVDLAGSERASQTLSAGTRLKEGCHINRSLLTLGTVIRKLSKGKNGHVPYRDSKLTRILQNSLGGNARTAIICTMSPARSHVEQSRNTLLFASCAKEVTTNAQVNLVVSEKALVKQLQRELARMEKELRSLGSGSVSSDFNGKLKQKEELIEKMEKQIKELEWQRNLAQSQVENLLRSVGEDRSSKLDEFSVTSSSDIGNPLLVEADLRRRTSESRDFDYPTMLSSTKKNYLDLSDNSEDDGFLLGDSTPQFSGPDPCKGWEEIARRAGEVPEDVCKEVRCIEMESSDINGKAEREEERKMLDVMVDKKAVVEVLSPGGVKKDKPLPKPCATHEDYESSLKKIDEELILYSKEGDGEVNPCYEIEDKEQSLNNGDEEFRSCPEHEANGLPLKKGGGELNSFAKKEDYEQSPKTGNIELSSCAKQEDNEPSPENEDKELNLCDKQEHNESSPTMGDREASRVDDTDNTTYEALKEKVKEMQKTIEYLMSMQALEQQSPSSEADYSSPCQFKLKRSRSCREILFNVQSPLWFEKSEQKENTPRDFIGRSRGARRLSEVKDTTGIGIGRFSNKHSHASSISFDAESTISSASIDAESTKESDAENGSSFHEFIAGLKEMASCHQSIDATQGRSEPGIIEIAHDDHDFVSGKGETEGIQQENAQNSKRLAEENSGATKDQTEGIVGDDVMQEAALVKTDFGENRKDNDLEKVEGTMQQHSSWPSEFERQQRQIIELWEVCHVPLVHRTYFFLLFKGDPSDFVYMEVELRRLAFLKDSLARESDASRRQSVKTLNREKEWLRKQIQKKFSKKEREELYQKWGIKLNSKQRSLQVAHNLWTDTTNLENTKESASLVAKLVGFAEPSQAPKEMFGLSLSPSSVNRKSFSWKYTKSLSGISFIG